MIGFFSVIAPYVLLMLIAVVLFELMNSSYKKSHPRKPARRKTPYEPLARPTRRRQR